MKKTYKKSTANVKLEEENEICHWSTSDNWAKEGGSCHGRSVDRAGVWVNTQAIWKTQETFNTF